MKFKFRKISALALALIMMLATATTAFAQEAVAGEGAATITISNASKGETYTAVSYTHLDVYKRQIWRPWTAAPEFYLSMSIPLIWYGFIMCGQKETRKRKRDG